MPRKKSSAKRSREAASKETKQVNIKDDGKDGHISQLPEDQSQDGQADSATDESSSEDEDDYGELITEEVEEGIQKVLEAIKTNDKDVLFNPKIRFFDDTGKAASTNKSEKHKPIYLKDYHRMNILAGNTFADEDEQEEYTVDGKQSYVDQQKEEKSKLLDEIKSAFDEGAGSGEEDQDEEFLTKKEPLEKIQRPSLNLPNPNKNEEKFLEEFVSNQAWIPRKGDKVVSLDHDPNMQEDDDEFDDAVEQFENAYNFRYEDPNSADIVSYARNQATLRRSTENSRRKKREEERQKKNSELTEKESSIQKKRALKVHKLTDVLEQLKKEYGADIDEPMVKKITNTLLNNDYKENDWDEVLSELFNEEFYDKKGKPTWDEDDEVMADFYDEQKIDQLADSGEEDEEQDEQQRREENNTKQKKEKKNDKLAKKKEKKNIKELVENAVEQNKLAIIEEVEKDKEERKSRSRTKEEQDLKFRYREVSPESFGLTTREIFAADDAQLNQFIGLKKFAPYRPKEQRMRDKRKVTKAKRLREWRKEVFRNENGIVPSKDEDSDSIPLPISHASKSKKKVHNPKQHKPSL